MDKARAIIDYSYNDEGKAVRDALYSAIQDKVLAHIESHKQEVAKTLIVPEESENELEDDLELEMEEEYAELDEISKERTIAAYVARMGRDDKDNDAKALKTITHIGNKHGVKGVARAAKAADKEYGLNDKNNPRKAFVKQVMSGTKNEEVESLDETMTRKHFQQVADVIKAHPDAKKRKELAMHHAGIFKASNPRFDHMKFMKAAGADIKEEVKMEELDEGTMTNITLGKKVKNKEGGHNQDVHYKGKKIGLISSYSHRTGTRYGMHHDATGDMTAGSRSAEDAIADLRWTHAEHLKDKKR